MNALAEQSPAVLAKEIAPLNELESWMATQNVVPPAPLEHRFTPGMYSRTIYMAAGTLLTSKIHRTEHQYVISKGKLRVWSAERGWVRLQAPFIGYTLPGTRRALYIEEDTVWTTFHPTHLTDVAEIEKWLIEPHDIPQPQEELT